MNDEVFSRLIAPVTRGIRLLFGRGVLTGTHDELKMQNVQLTGMDGETFDDVERPQQYGQISVPLPGAETFFACLGGQRDQTVVLVVEDRRSRPTGLTAGDTGVYHHEGHRITAIRLGSVTAHMPGTWESWDLNLGGGNVLTGIKVQDVGKNTADNVGGVYYRPLQYLLNEAWVTAASI